jgi:cellulose synthase/poly-beta-1,6-N-acetylglucosamine synthase-like glycosyltransferase
MPPERKHRRKRRRKSRWALFRWLKRKRIEHGPAFYNTIFIVLLCLLFILILFYFLGWLEFMGLSRPSTPKPIEASGS